MSKKLFSSIFLIVMIATIAKTSSARSASFPPIIGGFDQELDVTLTPEISAVFKAIRDGMKKPQDANDRDIVKISSRTFTIILNAAKFGGAKIPAIVEQFEQDVKQVELKLNPQDYTASCELNSEFNVPIHVTNEKPWDPVQASLPVQSEYDATWGDHDQLLKVQLHGDLGQNALYFRLKTDIGNINLKYVEFDFSQDDVITGKVTVGILGNTIVLDRHFKLKLQS